VEFIPGRRAKSCNCLTDWPNGSGPHERERFIEWRLIGRPTRPSPPATSLPLSHSSQGDPGRARSPQAAASAFFDALVCGIAHPGAKPAPTFADALECVIAPTEAIHSLRLGRLVRSRLSGNSARKTLKALSNRKRLHDSGMSELSPPGTFDPPLRGALRHNYYY